MARIRNPQLFSKRFDLDPNMLEELGVFDPILNVDSLLFIDPLILRNSIHPEMRDGATREFKEYFEKVFRLLRASRRVGDVAWRSAYNLLRFKETRGTCLGYGAASIIGSGWGEGDTNKVLATAKEAVDLGVEDPDLFPALVMLEVGLGPDLISDMTTTVILPSLLAFNTRILMELGIQTESQRVGRTVWPLARNPVSKGKPPLVLVPSDVLRELPVASDRADIDRVCSANWQLRKDVSELIGEIWKAKTLKEKAELRAKVMANKEALEALLAILKKTDGTPYDLIRDPEGIVSWLTRAIEATQANPLLLLSPKAKDVRSLATLIEQIMEQFATLVEDKGLWKDFWVNGDPRGEKSAQRLFFAVGDCYCKANDIDVSPEADSGSDPVDFKFSRGYRARYLVEVKLSTNPKLRPGYEKQIVAYQRAESTTESTYLIIWLRDSDRNRIDTVYAARQAAIDAGKKTPQIVLVDARPRLSASKL